MENEHERKMQNNWENILLIGNIHSVNNNQKKKKKGMVQQIFPVMVSNSGKMI